MNKVKWDNMSNSNIRSSLESMRNEHEVIKQKISSLLEELKRIETEYYIGNKELEKRIKGE